MSSGPQGCVVVALRQGDALGKGGGFLIQDSDPLQLQDLTPATRTWGGEATWGSL